MRPSPAFGSSPTAGACASRAISPATGGRNQLGAAAGRGLRHHLRWPHRAIRRSSTARRLPPCWPWTTRPRSRSPPASAARTCTQRVRRRHEVVWNDVAGAGGGGLSRFWPRPAWQAGAGVGTRSRTAIGRCRTSPCTRLAAQHGYPVYCTTGACGHAGWMTLGGTSASAPLLAGIVADMNSYSLAHGGAAAGIRQPVPVRQLRRRPRRVPRRHRRQQQSRRRGAATRPRPATTRPAASARRWPVRWPPTWPPTRPLSPRSQPPGSDGAALRCPDAPVRALHHPARRAQRCRGRHRRGARLRPGRLGDRRSRVAAHHRRPRRLVAAAAGAVAPDALACRLPGVGDDALRRSPTAARST